MYFTKTLCISFLSFAVLSCAQPEKSLNELIAIDSLMNKQVLLLTNEKATLTKVVQLDSLSEKSMEQIGDSITWAQELDVFRQLALINRPIYSGKYKITDGENDKNSNLQVLSIVTDEELPIRELKIYYLDVRSKIKKIEGLYFESNLLFSGARKLTLSFQDLKGRTALSKYEIIGGQKMILSDSVTYRIEAEITYQE